MVKYLPSQASILRMMRRDKEKIKEPIDIPKFSKKTSLDAVAAVLNEKKIPFKVEEEEHELILKLLPASNRSKNSLFIFDPKYILLVLKLGVVKFIANDGTFKARPNIICLQVVTYLVRQGGKV